MLKNILNTHHAILIEEEPDIFLDLVKSGFEQNGVNVLGNPDITFISFEKFGIAESRQIIELSLGAPIQESKKTIVFGFNTMTNEAQNALLKIFEDPSPQLQFIINTVSSNGLLPTLKSRLYIHKKTKVGDASDIQKAKSFLALPVGDKMKEVERLVKEYKDSGSKEEIKRFLLALHNISVKENKNIGAIKKITEALSYLDDKSASVKILLESVVLGVSW